jgi:hypothetical protein
MRGLLDGPPVAEAAFSHRVLAGEERLGAAAEDFARRLRA